MTLLNDGKKLECPYCHGDMIQGELVTARDWITWYPMTEEDLWDYEKDKMKIVIARPRLIRSTRKEAWVCPVCMKLVVDLEPQQQP